MPGGFGFEDEEREVGERPWYDRGTAGGASGWASGADDVGEQPLAQQPYSVPSLYGQPDPIAQPLGPTSRPLEPGEPSWGDYGRYGQYGQPSRPSWGPYGQPAQPSGGSYGQRGPVSGWGDSGDYGQAAVPSQRWGPPSRPSTYSSGSDWSAGPTTYGGYSMRAPNSQGWSGTGGPSGSEVARYVPGGYAPETYVPGGYGPPSGYGSYGGYGTHGGYGNSAEQDWARPPQVRRSSRRRLLVTLGVVAALLLVALAGAGYAVFNVFTPQATFNNFCSDLRGADYTDAYTLLEGTAQSQLTATGFAEAQATLVRVTGGIVGCGVNRAATTYQYHPGDTSATLNVAIEWASAGRLTGWAHLKNDGRWKIAALDSSVFGVNLGALAVATTYCQALIDQDYTAVYQLLSSQQRAQVPGLGPGPKPGAGPEYMKLGGWQDTVDGPVQACQVANLGKGNTDATVHVPVTMTRTKLGQRQDDVALAVESAGWKITSIGPQLQGTDTRPMLVATRFCSDVASGNYADSWSLLTAADQATVPEDQWADFSERIIPGYKMTGCTPDISMLKVTGTTASVQGTAQWISLTDGKTAPGTFKLTMTKVGDSWKL